MRLPKLFRRRTSQPPPIAESKPAAVATPNKKGTAAPLSTRERAVFETYAQILVAILQQEAVGVRAINIIRAARYVSLGATLENPVTMTKALKLAEPLALQLHAPNVIAQRDYGIIVYQIELDKSMWLAYTRTDLKHNTGVGLAERRREVVFDFGQAPHVLIAGATDSGKSETIKTILTGLALSHTPEEVQLVIIDPHHDYADFATLAHLTRPIATDLAEASAALSFVHDTLIRRKGMNDREGPKLVLVIDELPVITAEQPKHAALIDQITNEGRKFKVHIIGGVQKPTKENLKSVTNFGQRFIGRLSDARESAYVSGLAGLDAHRLSGQGDFIHLTPGDVSRFQVARTTTADLEQLPRRHTAPKSRAQSATTPYILRQAPVSNGVGRPANGLDPAALAACLYYADWGRTRLAGLTGLTEYNVSQHQTFAGDVQRAILGFMQGSAT